MTTTLYKEICARVRELTPAEQLQLLEELANLIRQQIVPPRKRKITKFQGLGKEMWRQIDVEKYIEEERNSWNG